MKMSYSSWSMGNGSTGQSRAAVMVGDRHRVVSMPNGFWQAQEHTMQKGTKTFDPWRGTNRPVDSFNEAMAQAKVESARFSATTSRNEKISQNS